MSLKLLPDELLDATEPTLLLVPPIAGAFRDDAELL